MFTWICPKCGTDVPPSYNECPNCASKESAPPPAVAPPEQPATTLKPAEPATPPAVQTPQPAVQQPLPSYAPPVQRKPGLPSWLVMLLAMATLGAAMAVLYLFILPSSRKEASPAAAAKLETPPPVATSTNPIARHLEIAGLRITESGPGRIKVQFLVVNHSAADLPDLKTTVKLRNNKGETVFEFPQEVSSIGPYESRDFTAQIKSPLRAYELPDWQLLRGELQITSQD